MVGRETRGLRSGPAGPQDRQTDQRYQDQRLRPALPPGVDLEHVDRGVQEGLSSQDRTLKRF